MTEKEHIYLAIPTIDGTIGKGADWLMCAANRFSADPSFPYRFTTNVIEGAKPPEYMWNCAAEAILNTNATRLWKMDNDMVPMKNAFDLLATPGDITAGLFFRYQYTTMEDTRLSICAYKRDFAGKLQPIAPPPEAPAIQKVDAVGGGSIVIRREVLEDPDMRLAPDQSPPAIFQRHQEPNGKITRSADIDFCERAGALGYDIRVNLGVPFDQMTRMGLNVVMALTAGGAMKDEDPTPRIHLAS